MNTLGDHIRTRRIDLGLFQSQVADEIGVHELTITNWESNESVPAVKYIPAILRFLGYEPHSPEGTFSERLANARRKQGLTQAQFAAIIGVDPATIRDWETARREPSARRQQIVERTIREGFFQAADKTPFRLPTY